MYEQQHPDYINNYTPLLIYEVLKLVVSSQD